MFDGWDSENELSDLSELPGQASSEADSSEGESGSQAVTGRREKVIMVFPNNDFSKFNIIPCFTIGHVFGMFEIIVYCDSRCR